MTFNRRRFSKVKSISLQNLTEIDTSEWKSSYHIKPKEIGRGHFSKVFHVVCKDTSTAYAAKVIRRRRSGRDLFNKIQKEIDLMRKLNDDNVDAVLKLHKTYENFSEVVLILELAKGGSLYNLIQDSPDGLDQDYARVITQKILEALVVFHSHNIVHMDIKADNILLREPYPSQNIAICDFGLAVQLKEGIKHKELVGTPDYMAPETVNYEDISVFSDIWSMGVLIYFMLTKVSPFIGNSKENTLSNVSLGKIQFIMKFEKPEYQSAKSLISSFCVKHPKSRLSAADALKHEWFTETKTQPQVQLNDGIIHNNQHPIEINDESELLYDDSLLSITNHSQLKSRCMSLSNITNTQLNSTKSSKTHLPYPSLKQPRFSLITQLKDVEEMQPEDNSITAELINNDYQDNIEQNILYETNNIKITTQNNSHDDGDNCVFNNDKNLFNGDQEKNEEFNDGNSVFTNCYQNKYEDINDNVININHCNGNHGDYEPHSNRNHEDKEPISNGNHGDYELYRNGNHDNIEITNQNEEYPNSQPIKLHYQFNDVNCFSSRESPYCNIENINTVAPQLHVNNDCNGDNMNDLGNHYNDDKSLFYIQNNEGNLENHEFKESQEYVNVVIERTHHDNEMSHNDYVSVKITNDENINDNIDGNNETNYDYFNWLKSCIIL